MKEDRGGDNNRFVPVDALFLGTGLIYLAERTGRSRGVQRAVARRAVIVARVDGPISIGEQRCISSPSAVDYIKQFDSGARANRNSSRAFHQRRLLRADRYGSIRDRAMISNCVCCRFISSLGEKTGEKMTMALLKEMASPFFLLYFSPTAKSATLKAVLTCLYMAV